MHHTFHDNIGMSLEVVSSEAKEDQTEDKEDKQQVCIGSRLSVGRLFMARLERLFIGYIGVASY